MNTVRHTLLNVLEELEALETNLEPAANRSRITRRCDYISELVDEVSGDYSGYPTGAALSVAALRAIIGEACPLPDLQLLH